LLNTQKIVKILPQSLNNTLQNKLKRPQYKIQNRCNSHNTFSCPQYKVTLMFMIILSPRTSP